MSEHENAPAAPPEGDHRKRIEALVRCLHHYGCPPDARLQGKVDADVADVLDSFDAALAAATARADEDEAGRLRWEQEAERLRGERADLQHKLAHWQRVAEESEAMAARRVEAMREAAIRMTIDHLRTYIRGYRNDLSETDKVAQIVLAVTRALPTTPAPGPSAEDAR